VKAASPLLALLLLCVWVGGCIGQEVPRRTRYVLDVTRQGPAAPLARGNLRLGRVGVDPRFERKGFVYQTGETVYESDFYHEFYSPPGILVRELTGKWLDASKVFSAVLATPDSRETQWALEASIERLFVDLRDPGAPRAVIQIEFSVVNVASSTPDAVFVRRYGAALKVADRQPESFVAGWSEGLTRILTSLESDLRGAFEVESQRREVHPVPEVAGVRHRTR